MLIFQICSGSFFPLSYYICLSNQAMQTCYMRFNDLFKRTLSFEEFLEWVIQKTWVFDRSLEQKACFFSVIASPFALICVWKDAAHAAPLCPHSCLFLDHLQFQFQASVAAISGKHCLPVYCWLTADKKRGKKNPNKRKLTYEEKGKTERNFPIPFICSCLEVYL